MADQERSNEEYDLRHSERIGEANTDYTEETSAEIAAPGVYDRRIDREEESETVAAGRGVGYAALALSILSLFVLPVLFGATGIVLGFIARRRGSESLGGWAIGIGAISIIVGMFVLPFF
ncbi:DUF4190 domain-containing protein [Cytobacillus sp. NCCP-133]|uniref:DUF4190 domain-containing protein n=1 Tax=Cytobacillus sp. NCCP-133 TaxID=766848 RepID=UPI0022318A3E|nr:DUF4190 domain-containing protein [Cytobacillus sp. NCCP-133]GLB58218.1 hypothetical protein NCCP133_03510 [Cytobacillus sp. NCCP-133]